MPLFLPSISGLERASICPTSQVLPHTERKRAGIWAARGNILHPFLADVPNIGRDAALERVPSQFREACAVIDTNFLETMREGAFAQEVAFGLDIYREGARELGRGLSRLEAYRLARPGELTGTVDVVGVTDDAVVVYDYKTGYTYFDVIERNWQLLGYAIAACLAYDRGHAYLAIIRVPEHGEPYFLRGEVSFEGLQSGLAALRELNERIGEMRMLQLAGERLPLVTGEHCKYCPAVASCPAIAKLQRRFTSPKGWRLPALGTGSDALYVEALRRGEFALAQLREKLEAYAHRNPIDLGNGVHWGPRRYSKDKVDVKRARPILEALMDAEAADVCIKTSETFTKDGLDDAIRGLKKRRKGVTIRRMKQEVLTQLRAAGALTTTYSYPVGEYHAPASLTEGVTSDGGTQGAEGEQGQEVLEAAPGEVAGEVEGG